MKPKSTLLALVIGLSLTSNNQTHGIDCSSKNIAIAACATIAGIAITKVTYDYFFGLTDAQEFDQAIKLCEQAEQLIESIDQNYGCHTAHINWHVIFNSYLTPCHARYPFFAYVQAMEKNIDKVVALEDELSSSKIRIFERRMKLITSLTRASDVESIEMKSSIEGYDFAIEEIQNTARSLKLKRKFLQHIKELAIVHPQYLIEKQQIRIEELEKKLYFTYPYAAHSTGSTWDHPRSTQRVYVHNTHTTHINNQNTVVNNSASHEQQHTPDTTPELPQPSAPSLQEVDSKKKLKPVQSGHEEDAWRDRFCDLGDSFNG